MQTQSPDTSPAAEGVLIRVAAEMPPRRKVELAFSETDAVRHAARAGLRSRYPQASEEELKCRLAALLLPRELVIAAYGWDPEVEGY